MKAMKFSSLLLLWACVGCAAVDAGSAATGASEAQIPQAGSILFLRGEEQIAAFRDQDERAGARLIPAATAPLALPAAQLPLSAPKVSVGGVDTAVDQLMRERRIAGVLVVKDGAVLYENYEFGNNRDSRWISFSVAKSVVAMLIGAAIEDGYIKSVDEKVTDYLPRLKGSSYDQTTIRNLLQMASGVAWNEDYADPKSDVASVDYATLALYEQLRFKERVAAPGEKFNYNTAETNLAGTLLRSAIGNNLSTYLYDKVWQPFGMEADAYWQLTEFGGGEFGGCCINATLRDYARLGLFALADGQLADGTRVLPKGWMAESVAPSKGFDGYGYFWWLGGDGSYQASGVFGQAIYINPKENMVIAVHSAWNEANSEQDFNMLDEVFAGLVQAAQGR
ncbi:MAG: serine hydrolase domain-containing protein [Pseudomonadales bacterium]